MCSEHVTSESLRLKRNDYMDGVMYDVWNVEANYKNTPRMHLSEQKVFVIYGQGSKSMKLIIKYWTFRSFQHKRFISDFI